MPFRALTWVVLTGCALGLAAQDPPKGGPSGEEPPDRLLTLLSTPVEVASKREQMAIDSPQAIEVLTADQIRASGVFRLVDVLKLMTSVQVYELGKDSARLTIRGTVVNAGNRNVQLLVDGIPLFDTESQPVSFDLIPVPIDAIERVEVVRGPSSSLYGANAQVGVVSITTRRAEDGTSLTLRGGAAGQGTTNTQGFYSYGAAGFKVATGFGASSQGDSGVSERVLDGTRQVDPQDQNHASQVFIRPEAVFGDGRVWALYSKAFSAVGPKVVETPAGILSYQFAQQRSSTEAVQVGWSQVWSPAFRTEWRLNRSHLIPVSLAPLEAVPGSPGSTATVAFLQALDPALKADYNILDSTADQVAIQGNWDASESWHVVFGLDASRLRAARAPIVGIQTDRSDSASGGFVSMDWALGRVNLSVGTRIENETLGGSRISPRVALVYSLSEGSVLRAGYFTSTRSPQVGEMVQDIRIPGRPAPIGNPDLKPEAFDNLEVGYRMDLAGWSLDLTAYRMLLKKVIGAEPTGTIVGGLPQAQFQNSGASLTNKGVEVTVTGELAPGWLLGFNATSLSLKDESGAQEAMSPRFLANLWTRYRYQDFRAYLALQQVGAYRIENFTDITAPTEATPARLQVHVNLGYDLSQRLSVSVYGINAARAWDPSTAGSPNNGHLIRFSRREVGFQAGYRY